MKKILEATGLYDFSEPGGILQSEIAAYEAGFSLVEEAIDTLLLNLFVQTASKVVLDEKERAFRYVPSTSDMTERRRMLLARYGDFAENSGKERFEKLLLAAGIEGSITENKAAQKLVVQIQKRLGISKEQAKRELESLLPAHLDIEIKE